MLFPDKKRNHKTTRPAFLSQRRCGYFVPIEHREEISVAVASNPRSTGRLPRVNELHRLSLMDLRRQCGWPSEQFIAVHSCEVAVNGWNKGQRTHRNRSVGDRILHRLSRKLQPILEHCERSRWSVAPPAIGGANAIDDVPLAIECLVRRPERVGTVINVCGFRGSTVQLNDFESLSLSKLVIRAVADVIAANIEARDFLADLIEASSKLFRKQVSSILEDTTLTVVSRLDQPNTLAHAQNPLRFRGESFQIG